MSTMTNNVLVLLGLLAAPVLSKEPALEALEGSSKQCIGGKIHSLSYSTVGVSSDKFIDLDTGDLASKLRSVTCDIDHTRLSLKFHNSVEATEYVLKFHDWNNHFITGGERWGCKSMVNRTAFVLRRVVGASQSAHLGDTLFISTAMARYDEVFETANIAYSTAGTCDPSEDRWQNGPVSVDKKVCLGYNTDCDGTAKKEIPLYTDAAGKVSVSCSNCWAALNTDVFVELTIGAFKVNKVSGGFRNAMLNTSMVFDTTAEKSWNVGVDKTLSLVATTYLVNFKVGPVPFMLYFDIPLEASASWQFNTNADLTVGTLAGVDLGDAYVSWDPTNHWTHTTPSPKFDMKPKISTKLNADVDMVGNIGLNPTFNMHFDRVFSYSLKASSSARAEVQGSTESKQMCLTSNYNLDVVANSEVDININLINFHKDWTWGPTDVYSKSGVVVPQKCVALPADMA